MLTPTPPSRIAIRSVHVSSKNLSGHDTQDDFAGRLRLTPDFKTIADFRKDNGKAIRRVCSVSFRQACMT
jgi:hypothetical protein